MYTSPLTERIRKRKSFADSELDLTSGILTSSQHQSTGTTPMVAINYQYSLNDHLNNQTYASNHQYDSIIGSNTNNNNCTMENNNNNQIEFSNYFRAKLLEPSLAAFETNHSDQLSYYNNNEHIPKYVLLMNQN